MSKVSELPGAAVVTTGLDGSTAPSAPVATRAKSGRTKPAGARTAPAERPVKFKVDVCVCTHNPDLGVLRLALAALAGQSVPTNAFRVTLIDNASEPPISDWVIEPLTARGVAARIVREPQLGIAPARQRAAHETNADWVCFIDDDNVVAENYLEIGLQFAADNPHVGAFGGRLLLPPGVEVRRAIKPFLPYVGIKDLGDVALSGPSAHWCEWEPPTAGSFVSRDVLTAFVDAIERERNILSLGRKGLNSAVSCEDSFIMRGAFGLGKSLAYVPKLSLYHYLRPHRLKLGYLLKLIYGYGKSHVLLERCLTPGLPTPDHYKDFNALRLTLWYSLKREASKPMVFSLGMLVYHIGAYRAYRTPI